MEIKFVISLGCRTAQLKRRNPNNPYSPQHFKDVFSFFYAPHKAKYRFYSIIVLLYYGGTLKMYDPKVNKYVTECEC